MAAQQHGLSNVAQIEALADQLSACADEIHARVMKDIKRHGGTRLSEKEQTRARALLEDEVMLRQRANGLYADAASIVVKGLSQPQRHVMELTAAAAEKIRKIAVIGDLTGLVAGLLLLGGAAASRQPAAIVLALEKIRQQLKAIETHSAKPAG